MGGGKRLSPAEQAAERAALEAKCRLAPLSSEEERRLERLNDLARGRARYRPARIRKLEAELAMLRAEEAAEQQAALSVQRTLPLVFVVRSAAA